MLGTCGCQTWHVVTPEVLPWFQDVRPEMTASVVVAGAKTKTRTYRTPPASRSQLPSSGLALPSGSRLVRGCACEQCACSHRARETNGALRQQASDPASHVSCPIPRAPARNLDGESPTAQARIASRLLLSMRTHSLRSECLIRGGAFLVGRGWPCHRRCCCCPSCPHATKLTQALAPTGIISLPLASGKRARVPWVLLSCQ